MIQKIGAGAVRQLPRFIQVQDKSAVKSNVATLSFSSNYTASSLVNAYQAYHGINLGKTVSFGQSLNSVLDKLKTSMVICRDMSKGKEGEKVGSKINVSSLINKYYDNLPQFEDAIKTNVVVSKNNDTVTEARTQLKRNYDGLLYEMSVRQPKRDYFEPTDKTLNLQQNLQITQSKKPEEKAYVLNTKGKLMAVVEDGDNVLLTNAGEFEKLPNQEGAKLIVSASKADNKEFKAFTPEAQSVKEREPQPSIGEGTEIIIGMEDGRFVPEIIDSINTFIDKINKGEIVLNQFVAKPDAKKTQLTMLAGGFGSRAEYTNASSDGIFHSKKGGAQSTKGVFRTATGLTPMETTFITLHNAGLLDCSKGKLKLGDNIKLYLNASGVNKGNGSFTVDLYNEMERDGRNSLTLFPNDSMSRMTNATSRMFDIMDSGKAAIAMIAKEVKAKDAENNFGIMKLGKDNEILEFAEKPKKIPDGYERNGMCLTNTFQFSVSKEAFKALSIIEKYLPDAKGKEPKDWSGTFVPILMALTQKDNPDEINSFLNKALNKNNDPEQVVNIPADIIAEAKSVLGNQKIYAVPTDEPWADCGTLNQLYHTTMEIASGAFPLEDFERKHVLDSINTQTGLIASTPEQKAEIESKYEIKGEVMVVPKAKKVDKRIVDRYIKKGLISVNQPK